MFAIIDRVIPKPASQMRYVEATSEDPTLQVVLKVLRKGWPDHKSQCSSPAKPFWSVRHHLFEVNGLLLCGK